MSFFEILYFNKNLRVELKFSKKKRNLTRKASCLFWCPCGLDWGSRPQWPFRKKYKFKYIFFLNVQFKSIYSFLHKLNSVCVEMRRRSPQEIHLPERALLSFLIIRIRMRHCTLYCINISIYEKYKLKNVNMFESASFYIRHVETIDGLCVGHQPRPLADDPLVQSPRLE